MVGWQDATAGRGFVRAFSETGVADGIALSLGNQPVKALSLGVTGDGRILAS